MSRSTVPALLAAAIIATGCSDSSNNSSSSTPDAQDEISTISGSAVKGLMSSATVSIHSIVDGSPSLLPLATGQTDDAGQYTINITNYTGPVIVLLTTTTSTLMVCDSAIGCGTTVNNSLDTNTNGTIDFGEKYQPSLNLELTAMVPTVTAGEDLPVQITPITHAAAELAVAQVASGGTLDASTISSANIQVAAVLGLPSDILSTPPVDITQIPADATTDAIEYAALLGSLATMAAEDGTDNSAIIDEFAEALILNDGQLVQNSSADVFTLDELYEKSIEVVVAAETTSDANLEVIQSELSESQLISQNAEAGAVTDVVIPEDTGTLTTMLAAKSLSSDVRTWGNLIEQQGDGPAQQLETHVDAIEPTLDVAADNLELKRGMEHLFGSDTSVAAFDQLADALEFAFDVAETAYRLELASGNLDSLGDIDYTNDYPNAVITGTIAKATDHATLVINGVFNGQSIELYFTSENLKTENTSAKIALDDSQPSIIQNNEAKLILRGGAAATASMTIDTLTGDATDGSDPLDSITFAVASLEVEISEKATESITNPATFIGTMAYVISEDLAALNTSLENLSVDNAPVFADFPGVPSALGTHYAQYFLRFKGSALNTAEQFDGTIFLASAATETMVEGESEFDAEYIGFQFTGMLTNGTGDSMTGSMAVISEAEKAGRYNVTSYDFNGTVATAAGDSFTGLVSIELESPAAGGTVLTDEFGDEIFNLSSASLSGSFNASTGESLVASVIASSSNASTFNPESDETENNYADLNLVITSRLQLSGVPLARFTLSGERSGFEDGFANLDISYGGTFSNDAFSGPARRIQIAYDSTALKDTSKTGITITNTEGVSMLLAITCEDIADDTDCDGDGYVEDGDIVGEIKVGTESIAEINYLNGLRVIRYIDGSIESL